MRLLTQSRAFPRYCYSRLGSTLQRTEFVAEVGKPIISSVANEHHFPTSTPPPPLPRQRRSGKRTTSSIFSVVSTPLGQSPGTNSLTCTCEKAGSSNSLYALCPAPSTNGSPFFPGTLLTSFITSGDSMRLWFFVCSTPFSISGVVGNPLEVRDS